MGQNVTRKLIESHVASGRMEPGEDIAVRIDQTLTQDATGIMIMLEFEAMDIPHVKTEVSAQYVDHNQLQTETGHLQMFTCAGARIHHQHLANFGVLPLTFADPDDHGRIDQGDTLALEDAPAVLDGGGDAITVYNRPKDEAYEAAFALSERQRAMILTGSLINVVRAEA